MSKLSQELPSREQPSSEQAHVKRVVMPQKPAAAKTELLFSAEAKSTLDFKQVDAHLSNERTFLAWTWTGMMLMGFGVAVTKMRIAISDFSQSTGSALQSSGNHEISPVTMGMLFLVVGLLTILMSAYRYLVVQNQLRKQMYTHADTFILVFLLALTFLSGTLIVLVLQLR